MKDRIANNLRYIVAGVLLVSSFLTASIAFAADQQGERGWERGGMMIHMPGVFGTVTAISGSTITIDSKGFGPNATETTYTVDAKSATVFKDQATSSVGNIAVGDMISAQGTVNGTTVIATRIHDGLMGHGIMGGRGRGAESDTIVQGNGQPVVGGNVTAINGSTLTITNKSNMTYTVDASGATVEKDRKLSALGDIEVGDSVVVQGTVNGTSIDASSVIDSGVHVQGTAESQKGSDGHEGFGGMFGGFFGGMGGFLHGLFGFF